jgi:hypothetical protein
LSSSCARPLPADGLQSKAIATALNERERLGSTGLRRRCRDPAGKIEGLTHVFGYFAR